MSLRKLALLLGVAALAFTGAGCERSQDSVKHKSGKYQGKEDAQPWQGGKFAGDKAAWEREVKARTMAQNEHKRTN